MTLTLCRHCGKGNASRARGLCWSCFNRLDVRHLYPITSKFCRRGVLDFCGKARLPEPTTALPRTPEKVAVLEERARLGLSLWHPLDATRE